MSNEIASLVVRVEGKDVGLSALLNRVDKELDATAKRAKGATDAIGGGLGGAAQKGAAGLGSFANSAAQTATTLIGLGSALEVGTQLFNSFRDAFNFRAELDGTTASINLQLQGVRDSGQVWNEASAYATKYKLTQEETTNTVQASIGILKQSQASVEQTFGVLQRLTVLAPGKSIEDAAFAVRELASGDIISISDQFNISKDRAYEMRDAIQSGADVVTVLSKFLDQSNIKMDSLAIRTQGVAGKMKDLAIAEEQLKLAQAEFAQGPGLAILEQQINVTRGATRLLTADFGQMSLALQQVAAENPWIKLLPGFAQAEAQMQLMAQRQQELNAAQQAGTTGGTQWGAVQQESATAADAATQAIQAQATALEQAAQQAVLDATNTEALSVAKKALEDAALSAADSVLAGGGNIAAEADRLAASSSQVDILTAAFIRLKIATGEAQAAADRAAGQARLAGQAGQTRDLLKPFGGLGFNAPGRSGTSDADAFRTISATQTELNKPVPPKPKPTGGRGGGGGTAGITAQRTLNNQEADLAQKHQDKLAQILADGMQKRMQAEEAFHQTQRRGRISFYTSLANVTDAAQQQALAARYEAIQQEANAIKESQGADVAQAYAVAAEKALQEQRQLEEQIAEAKKNNDPGRAEFLTGLLAMQKAADDEELAAIKTKGSAIQAERDKQYSAEEADFAAHLERMGVAYERKVAALPGLKTALGAGGTGSLPSPASVAQAQAGGSASPSSAAPTKSGATPVEDIATPPAVDAMSGYLGKKLEELGTKLDTLDRRLGEVDRSVRNLKRDRAYE